MITLLHMKTITRFSSYLAQIISEWEMLKKNDRGNQNTQSRSLWDNVEQYGTAGQGTDNKAHAHCMLGT